jgi:hypothetical protein
LRLKSVREAAAAFGRLSRFAKGSVFAAAALVVVAGAGIALGDSKPGPLEAGPRPIEVKAQPIEGFDKLDTQKTRFGKLTWKGGLELTSPSPNFGGWSALALGPDGKSLVALSDAGTWMTGTLVYDGDKPTGITKARLGALLERAGTPFTDYEDRDAEGMAVVEGTPAKGRALVSFERNHRIGWFDVDENGLSPVQSYVPLPPAMQDAEDNRGLEAVTMLRGGPYKGSLVAIAERLPDGSGNHTGWIWVNGKAQTFHVVNSDGYDITDVAALPNGGLLVLERRFRLPEGVKTRLLLVRANELRPGALVRGEMLLDASMNQEIDNMEGMAVHAAADGGVIVTLISDDNFNHSLQRTLLLQFALDAGDMASAGARP